MKMISEDGIQLLIKAQNGNHIAEEELIELIQTQFMGKRIGKYLRRNRQVDDDDLRQEFLIGVALNINRANLDMGDPIEFLITQGIYKVRSYLRKHIIQNTSQICDECGYITRLNRVGSQYICKKCGSTQITTQELDDHNEILLNSMVDNAQSVEDEVISNTLIRKFEETLTPNTNVHRLYMILMDEEINRYNPAVKNFIKEIAHKWGGCSENNVVQNMNKLKDKVIQFAKDNDLRIDNGCFILIEDLEELNNENYR